MNDYRKVRDDTPNKIGNKFMQGLIKVYALGAVFALIDASLHGQLQILLDDPIITGRSITWMTIIYGSLNLGLALLLRNSRLVAGIALFGFIFAQGGLWFYRNELGDPFFSYRSIAFMAGIFVISLLAGWISARFQGKIPGLYRAASLLVVSMVVISSISFFTRVAPPESPDPWPEGPETTSEMSSKPNVLLITLDTVRPDHLGMDDYEMIKTPNLDKLAEDGVIFLRGISQAPITPVSHASILTGVYPPRHNLRNFEHNNQLSKENLLLSEILREEGYLTGAIIASTTLHPLFGLDRGFDVYHYIPSSETYLFTGFGRSLLPTVLQISGVVKDRTAYRGGKEQTDDALLWLDSYNDIPFFLWLHYFDVHDPYFPDPKSQSPDRHPGRGNNELSGLQFNYDSEIVGLDDQIGRIIKRMNEYEILDETIIAVISDHGEGLGDHNYIGHTKRIYDEQLRLVLFLRYPEKIRKGQVVSAQVRSIDLLPTVLEILDIQAPREIDGLSLLPLIESGGDSQDRIAFSETFAPDETDLHLVAVNDGRFKLIRSLGGNNWLYDMKEDPGESYDLADDRPEVIARLGALLDLYLSNGGQVTVEEQPAELDDEIREKLQALGYINN